ncbi:MAG TPA: YceI family protein [Bacteroidales bacterium]|nr:YceI family protein [Bacteroidales bacterium]
MQAPKIKWSIDPSHSEIGFKVKHLMITNVKGEFRNFDATIYTTGEDFNNAEINFSMDPASINTGDEKRDGHLKSADFFDLDNHRSITFTSRSLKSMDEEGVYELDGDLTIKGITKPVKLEVEFAGMMKDPWGNQKAGFTLSGKINRKEWGLNWNVPLEAGGMLVGEEVRITADVQLVKQ